jgi:hypothetical protein
MQKYSTNNTKHSKTSIHITEIPTHYKTHTHTHTHPHIKNPHIHTLKTHTYTHPHITRQVKTTTVQDTHKMKQSRYNQIPSAYGHPNVRGTFITKKFTVTQEHLHTTRE